MNKRLLTLAAIALLTAAAFANIYFTAGMNSLFVPVGSDGDTLWAGRQGGWTSRWESNNSAVTQSSKDLELGAYGNFGGYAGFNFDMHIAEDNQSFSHWEEFIWVRPFGTSHDEPILMEISAGIMNNWTLRGDLLLPDYDWMSYGKADGHTTLQKQDDQPSFMEGAWCSGLQFEFYLPNLYVSVGLPLMGWFYGNGNSWNAGIDQDWSWNGNEWQCGYRDIMVQGAYTIPNVARFGLAWYGAIMNADEAADTTDVCDEMNYAEVCFGFDIYLIPNLLLRGGIKWNVAESGYTLYYLEQTGVYSDGRWLLEPHLVAMYQLWTLLGLDRPLTLYANCAVFLWNWEDANGDEVKHDPRIQVGVGVMAQLTDRIWLDTAVRYINEEVYEVPGDDDYEGGNDAVGFLVGFRYICSSNGQIGIGFQGVTNIGFCNDSGTTLQPAEEGDFCWAIPVRVHVWF